MFQYMIQDDQLVPVRRQVGMFEIGTMYDKSAAFGYVGHCWVGLNTLGFIAQVSSGLKHLSMCATDIKQPPRGSMAREFLHLAACVSIEQRTDNTTAASVASDAVALGILFG